DETKEKLQAFWKHIAYLIIDKVSMISKSFFTLLSRQISIGKEKSRVPSKALFYPTNLMIDSVDSQIGRSIYEEFVNVVILQEQMQVTDPVWRDFLEHLRYGRVQKWHLMMLHQLVITSPHCPETDFQSLPWSDASLVMPRHAMRQLWNDSANRKHCRGTSSQLYICEAEDSIKKRKLTIREHYAVAGRRYTEDGCRKRNQKNELPARVEIAVGMKVMVTSNVETDLDITNGARGVITDIILHPDEPPIDPSAPIVKLQHLPAYILVKLNQTRA
ncbi:uncharacterized protein PHACADRAFT_63613, partial [Phanerochaete carnosa HHB-10118-sp]